MAVLSDIGVVRALANDGLLIDPGPRLTQPVAVRPCSVDLRLRPAIKRRKACEGEVATRMARGIHEITDDFEQLVGLPVGYHVTVQPGEMILGSTDE